MDPLIEVVILTDCKKKKTTTGKSWMYLAELTSAVGLYFRGYAGKL